MAIREPDSIKPMVLLILIGNWYGLVIYTQREMKKEKILYLYFLYQSIVVFLILRLMMSLWVNMLKDLRINHCTKRFIPVILCSI